MVSASDCLPEEDYFQMMVLCYDLSNNDMFKALRIFDNWDIVKIYNLHSIKKACEYQNPDIKLREEHGK